MSSFFSSRQWNRVSLFLLLGFFAIRIFSFYTHFWIWPQATVGILLLIAFVLAFIKNPRWAWYFIMAELLLGGSGHFIELFGISLRTWLLMTYIILLSVQTFLRHTKKVPLLLPMNLLPLFGLFACAIIFAIINGNWHGNDPKLIVQDAIPFLYFILLIPSYEYLKEKEVQKWMWELILAFIAGSAIFSVFTFVLFSTGTQILHGEYYKWYRDVVAGKITDLHSGFFRIVTPEHLLIPPLTLVLMSVAMFEKKIKPYLIITLTGAFLILSLNLSRAYFLGVGIATFFLLLKHSLKHWIKISVLSVFLIFFTFCGTYFLASHGHSLGLEVFGLRLQSFTSPQIEESTYTRTALLPAIWKKIQEAPILGSGLGSTVTFENPVTHQLVTTPQFDWGYFELWTELGAIGLTLYAVLLLSIGYVLLTHTYKNNNHSHVAIGLFGGCISLLIITLFTPALFHVFGIVFLTLALAFVLLPSNLWERVQLYLRRLL